MNIGGVADRASGAAKAARGAFDRLTTTLGPYARAGREFARPVISVVTGLGWGVLLLGVGSWFLGWRYGWNEMMVIAAVCWIVLLLAVLMTLGRAQLAIELTADPQRVTVGAPAAGSITVRNTARRPLLPIGLELPLGPGHARFLLPLLRAGAEHEEVFVVPTTHRCVMEVGPVSSVRGDPLGLLRRAVPWTESLEIFVHPITVHLDSLGAGLLRDLEGQTTNDISLSDLAFHALREYQPGDDRRYIHWRSTARIGKFMVRQFLDTRRSQVCIVVDSHRDSYPDADDYELAISAAASLTIRVVQDEQEVTVMAGEHAAPNAAPQRVLDVYSRAELSDHGLVDLVRRGLRISPDISLAILVSGSRMPFTELQRAASEFPPEVRVLLLTIDKDAPTSMRSVSGVSVLSLQRLGDLASLAQGALA